MPTPTSRAAMSKPTTGEDQDIAVLNANFDTIDQHLGARQVTSGTMPSSPFRGMIVEQTDTGQVYWFNGTKWMWIGGSWSTIRSRPNFTATASTVNQVIGGFATDLRSYGPTIPYNANAFDLPEGLWLIAVRAEVASTSGQALQIYAPSANVILAETTFTAASQVTGTTAILSSSGVTSVYPRYRNSTGAGVAWAGVAIEIYKVAPVFPV